MTKLNIITPFSCRDEIREIKLKMGRFSGEKHCFEFAHQVYFSLFCGDPFEMKGMRERARGRTHGWQLGGSESAESEIRVNQSFS